MRATENRVRNMRARAWRAEEALALVWAEVQSFRAEAESRYGVQIEREHDARVKAILAPEESQTPEPDESPKGGA